MKTYYMPCMLLALLAIGCSKDNLTDGGGDPIDPGTKASYTLLLSSNGKLNAQPLDATSKTISINSGEGPFTNIGIPDLNYKEGSELLMYHKKNECLGEVTKYDFNDSASLKIEVFGDRGNCNLITTAIAHSNTSVYVGYSLSSPQQGYFVRIIDTSTSEYDFIDVELDEKPVQFALANNRLFILTLDVEITNENGLTVMDLSSKALIYDTNLGYNVRQIFLNKSGNLIISYDGLHTVLNTATMGVEYVNYKIDTKPDFANSLSNHFDSKGLLYFKRPTDGEHPHIPAVYDFDKNLTYLYIFENFLTQAQIQFDFEIDDTTLVGFDEKNGLILIGYKKSTNANKGGILRIKPVPEPAFIDNLDLDGVPMDLYIK